MAEEEGLARRLRIREDLVLAVVDIRLREARGSLQDVLPRLERTIDPRRGATGRDVREALRLIQAAIDRVEEVRRENAGDDL